MTNLEIDEFDIPWATVDEIDKVLNVDIPFIYNTSKKDEEGTHWVSAVLIKGNTLYIYDSLGKDNERVNDDYLKTKLKEMNIKPYYYDNKSQTDDSNWCGLFSIAVCLNMRDVKNKTIDNLNKIINVLFGIDKTPTISDEIKVLQSII